MLLILLLTLFLNYIEIIFLYINLYKKINNKNNNNIKMKVLTAVVNNPIYIAIQYHTLKKFFQGEYEFIVFNDAKDFPDYSNFNDTNLKNEIENVCKNLNIKCINVPNEHHKTQIDACLRCADSLNFMLKYQKENPDKYLIIDSDMFLIDYFNPSKYSNYDCAVILQSRDDNRINYFWNGLFYFDMNKMKNKSLLDWSCCDQCDVGGMMHKWINEWLKEDNSHTLPTVETIRHSNGNLINDNIYFIRHLWSCTWDESELPSNFIKNKDFKDFLKNDIRNTNGKYFCEIYDNCILHIRAGGNWLKENKINHIYYTQQLLKFISKLIE